MTYTEEVAAWLSAANATPRLDYTPSDLGDDEPSPTTMTAADSDGLAAENQQARSFDRFVA